MSKIEKMSVLGVWSSGMKDKQVTSFFFPLTILVRWNRASKMVSSSRTPELPGP
uniref:Uncharacterized protein n=1 Tax=Eptatretus burgeri TaxID=7764 RepID=A0A8C4QLZ6_EPTBU